MILYDRTTAVARFQASNARRFSLASVPRIREATECTIPATVSSSPVDHPFVAFGSPARRFPDPAESWYSPFRACWRPTCRWTVRTARPRPESPENKDLTIWWGYKMSKGDA